MAGLGTFPGIDECVFCFGRRRVATQREVAEHLRMVSDACRAALEGPDGTWYACPSCGPKGVVKWHSEAWDDE